MSNGEAYYSTFALRRREDCDTLPSTEVALLASSLVTASNRLAHISRENANIHLSGDGWLTPENCQGRCFSRQETSEIRFAHIGSRRCVAEWRSDVAAVQGEPAAPCATRCGLTVSTRHSKAVCIAAQRLTSTDRGTLPTRCDRLLHGPWRGAEPQGKELRESRSARADIRSKADMVRRGRDLSELLVSVSGDREGCYALSHTGVGLVRAGQRPSAGGPSLVDLGLAARAHAPFRDQACCDADVAPGPRGAR